MGNEIRGFQKTPLSKHVGNKVKSIFVGLGDAFAQDPFKQTYSVSQTESNMYRWSKNNTSYYSDAMPETEVYTSQDSEEDITTNGIHYDFESIEEASKILDRAM